MYLVCSTCLCVGCFVPTHTPVGCSRYLLLRPQTHYVLYSWASYCICMYQTCRYIDNDQVFQKCSYLLLPTARQTSPSLWLNHVVPSTWFRFCGIHSAPTLNVLRKYRFWQYSTSNCMSSRASGRCATNEGPPGAATVYFRIVYTPGT